MSPDVDDDADTAARWEIWHLSWQAAAGRELFSDVQLYGKVRGRLIDAHRSRAAVMLDFLLLPTEIHVLTGVRAGQRVGDVARLVGHVVSRWVTASDQLRSPVFAGPCRWHRVASPAELCEEIRLLAWRPVCQGLCRWPVHYANGGLRAAVGLKPARGFDTRPVLSLFAESTPDARAALRRLISLRPSEQESLVWELRHGLAYAQGPLGGAMHMGRPLRGPAALLLAASGNHVDGALRLLADWVASRLAKQSPLNLRAPANDQAARGRALVACLATELELCSAATVARFFGKAKATISEQMARCRARHEDRRLLKTPVRQIVQETLGVRARSAARQRPGAGD